jgi:hypothetical protein
MDMLEGMVAALQQWPCPECRGRKVIAFTKPPQACPVCLGTGIHPIALGALEPYYAEQARLAERQKQMDEDAKRDEAWERAAFEEEEVMGVDEDEIEQHAPNCMIWQIDAAASRGDGFPEPEDVACTCGLVARQNKHVDDFSHPDEEIDVDALRDVPVSRQVWLRARAAALEEQANEIEDDGLE